MKMLSNLFVFGIVLYGSMLGYLFLFQDKFIFFPPAPDANWYRQMQKYEYYIDTEKERLHGWHIKNPQVNHSSIIYFGGNAEDVVYNLIDAKYFAAHKLFFTNLPGYGNSTGKPSQKSFYENALQAYDVIVDKHGLDPDNIIIMGRSLGSAVAAHVAANRKAKGLILVTPFDSLENIAAQQFSWFPVRSLLRNKFDSIELIKRVETPILLIGAGSDEIISRSSLDNLYRAQPETCQLLMVPGAGHNDISRKDGYFEYINGFILANTLLAE